MRAGIFASILMLSLFLITQQADTDKAKNETEKAESQPKASLQAKPPAPQQRLPSLPPPPEHITIMTFNLNWGYDDEWDCYSWKNRRQLAVDVIKRQQITVLGLQQPTNTQMDYILGQLGRDYDWFPARKTVDKVVGEHGAMIYNARRVALKASGKFWLSDQPNVAWSQFPEASDSRLVTWGLFQRTHKPSEDKLSNFFYMFNVHLESWEENARVKQSLMILRKISEIAKPVSVDVNGSSSKVKPTVFLVGDFNSNKAGPAWKLFTGKIAAKGLNNGSFQDAWLTTKRRNNPVRDTFHEYRGYKVPDQNGSNHHDFVLYQQPAYGSLSAKNVEVVEATVVVDSDETRHLYPSDHYPVLARFKM